MFDRDIFLQRRQKVAAAVGKANHQQKDGVIVVCAAFEQERQRFRQNSYFYYLFGITEPGAVGLILLNGDAILYLPDFGGARSLWVDEQVSLGSDHSLFSLAAIKPMGEVQRGYSSTTVFTLGGYKQLINDIKEVVQKKGIIAGIWGETAGEVAICNLMQFLQQACLSSGVFYNATAIVDGLRRIKSEQELVLIRQAIDITIAAHHVAVNALRPGLKEYELQAQIEAEFVRQGALFNAFPSIVGGGVKTTVLHYVENNRVLEAGDLVVVDIGAEYGYYAADLTRTYPVSGQYLPRQREIYDWVLAAQLYAASIAKPGMFLRNSLAKELSLHWLVTEFFKKEGLEKFFPHGLGHYMGLDVHDVGTYLEPLQPGDVFTIDPGLYLPHESIGVRIEDDYLVTASGVTCLSGALPKKAQELEKLTNN
jgi:Xaa-Pro aminopeptidase